MAPAAAPKVATPKAATPKASALKAATPARKEPPPQATNTPMPPPSMAFKQEITEEPKGVVPPELQHTVEARVRG